MSVIAPEARVTREDYDLFILRDDSDASPLQIMQND